MKILRVEKKRESHQEGPQLPIWGLGFSLTHSVPFQGSIPPLTVYIRQHFDKFLYVSGKAESINLKYTLQLLPLLVTEFALGPGLHEVNGVRGITPPVRLQIPQPGQAICA